MRKVVLVAGLALGVALVAQTVGSGGGAVLAGLATNNNRLIAVSDGINQGGGTTDLRIDGWGDGVSTNYSSALTSAQLAVYNGNSQFDRLRSTTADGSSKTGQLEAAPVMGYDHINSASTTSVKDGKAILHHITVNGPAAATVTVFDYGSGTCTGSPSGDVVAVITV